jgi:hypothetical protein
MAKGKTATAGELDAMFDAGEDISEYLDWSKATRPGRAVQRVNVDFPVDLLREIDREADSIGVTRQAFIKMRVADTLSRVPTLQSSQSAEIDERPSRLKRKAVRRPKATRRAATSRR